MILSFWDAGRFWAKVQKAGPDECWLWTGARNDSDYGIIRLNKCNHRATKISLLLGGRPLPDGLCALHTCDNPPCVNPTHLVHGTKGENIQQSYDRGRRPVIDVGYLNTGSGNGMSKLDNDKVKQIKKLLPSMTDLQIGIMFGVTPSNIYCIRKGKTWKHVA